jgi:hypothetical protein
METPHQNARKIQLASNAIGTGNPLLGQLDQILHQGEGFTST